MRFDELVNNRPMATSQADLLTSLRNFAHDEQAVAIQKLLDVWSRPLTEKLANGLSQGFTRLACGHDSTSLWGLR